MGTSRRGQGPCPGQPLQDINGMLAPRVRASPLKGRVLGIFLSPDSMCPPLPLHTSEPFTCIYGFYLLTSILIKKANSGRLSQVSYSIKRIMLGVLIDKESRDQGSVRCRKSSRKLLSFWIWSLRTLWVAINSDKMSSQRQKIIFISFGRD